MLVRFHSEAGGFVMFGEVAVKLLRMMGHSGTVPSAILAEDIPAAVRRLEDALRTQPAEARGGGERDDDEESKVGLRVRAVPLLELLHRASDEGVSVTWDREGR